MTLREELVRMREHRVVWGGGGRGRRGDPSETQFTLRPPGPLGDQSLSTVIDAAGTVGTIQTGWTASVGEEHDTPISSIQLHLVFKWWWDGQGPAEPTIRMQFREGSSGTARDAVEFLATTLAAEDVITTLGPYGVSTNQDGGAWTWARLSSLQFNVQADVDHQGSQINTNLRVFEVWAVVVP